MRRSPPRRAGDPPCAAGRRPRPAASQEGGQIVAAQVHEPPRRRRDVHPRPPTDEQVVLGVRSRRASDRLRSPRCGHPAALVVIGVGGGGEQHLARRRVTVVLSAPPTRTRSPSDRCCSRIVVGANAISSVPCGRRPRSTTNRRSPGRCSSRTWALGGRRPAPRVPRGADGVADVTVPRRRRRRSSPGGAHHPRRARSSTRPPNGGVG